MLKAKKIGNRRIIWLQINWIGLIINLPILVSASKENTFFWVYRPIKSQIKTVAFFGDTRDHYEHIGEVKPLTQIFAMFTGTSKHWPQTDPARKILVPAEGNGPYGPVTGPLGP